MSQPRRQKHQFNERFFSHPGEDREAAQFRRSRRQMLLDLLGMTSEEAKGKTNDELKSMLDSQELAYAMEADDEVKLTEAIETQDLADRIDPTVHFDEYVPKMGDEDGIVVATFKVFGKAPSVDLENFMEKGYNWIIDAETSPGEVGDDKYLVFVEAERRTHFPEKFIELIKDLENVTNIKRDQWRMTYFVTAKSNPEHPLTQGNMATHIPLSPKAYRLMKRGQETMESMLNSARISRHKGDIDGFAPFKRRDREE